MNEYVLYVYNDGRGWGRNVKEAAGAIGIKVKNLRFAWQVPNRENMSAFVRVTYHKMEREKRLAEVIAQKDKVTLIPRVHETRLFYEKIAQSKLFKDWMPETLHITSRDEACEVMEKIEYPFVSKSNRGTCSFNTRLIKDKIAAKREIDLAFSEQGLPVYKGHQRGYLLWQEFLPNNPHDWRVICIAKKYFYAVKRRNRKDSPFASGSGHHERISELSEDTVNLLNFCVDFVRTNNLYMASLDVLRGRKQPFVIVETQCNWSRGRLDTEARFFEKAGAEWRPTDYVSSQLFDVIAKSIDEGSFRGS